MTTPTKDAQAALAILDDHPFLGMPVPGTWIKLGVREARQIQAALRALIEPPIGDEREALTRSVGMLLAENDDMEVMDDDAFEIVRDSLVKGLMELYPAGFRRQVSHPEPVTEAEVEAAHTAYLNRVFGFPGHPAMRAALEAARAVRLSAPEEER